MRRISDADLPHSSSVTKRSISSLFYFALNPHVQEVSRSFREKILAEPIHAACRVLPSIKRTCIAAALSFSATGENRVNVKEPVNVNPFCSHEIFSTALQLACMEFHQLEKFCAEYY